MPNSQISVLAASATALIPSSSAPCTAVLSNVGSYDVYLGGSDASTSKGWKLGAGRVQTVKLGPGHSLYGRADGTDSTVNVVFLPGGMEVKPPGGAVFAGVAVYTPEKYGAARDGVTDDRVAIQTAIDTAYDAGGGIVQLRAGNYRVNENGAGIALLLKTGVRLQGAGMHVTTISTDNTLAVAPYCLIAPYAYNTTSTPYGAHELDIRDLTLTGTSAAIVGNPANLHNLAGIAHTPGALLDGVGFDTTACHYAEINASRNVLIRDCSTVGNGNHGLSKFQLDTGGACGQRSSAAFVSSAIQSPGAGTYGTGIFTLITVASTANMKIGDHVVISGANGAQAGVYNSLGGYRIVSIPSPTTLAINLGWSTGTPNVASTATTAGTVTVQPAVSRVKFLRYTDKAPSDQTDVVNLSFLMLSHTTMAGVFRDITVDGCFIMPRTFITDPGGVKAVIGFDGAALPVEFSGFKFINNTFGNGGNSGVLTLLDLSATYSSTYARNISDIHIANNRCERTGMFSFLRCGDVVNTNGQVRTSLTMLNGQPAECSYFRNILVENNYIDIAQRGGSTSIARPTVPFIFGSADKVTCKNNHVVLDNRSPENLQTAWSSGSLIGFIFDHVRDLTVHHCSVRVHLDVRSLNSSPQTASTCYGFVFGCSAFELAASLTPGHHSWLGNSVYGFSVGGVGTDLIVRGFTEVLTNGTTGISSWASATRPAVTGEWAGNRTYSSPATSVDTWATDYLHLNTPVNGSLTSAITDASELTTWGRHAWTRADALRGYTVATLPAGVSGMAAYVTDATAPTYLGTLTGGGAVRCPVFHNGTAWVSN